MSTLIIAQDNDVELEGFQLARDFSFINDAVFELTLGDLTTEKTITAATNDSPIEITATAHGFENGDEVVISQVAGNRAANGVFTVANKTADTFELSGSTGDGDYVGGGKVRLAVSGATELSMPYVSGSNGRYIGVVPASTPLVANRRYVEVFFGVNYDHVMERQVTAKVG